MRVVDDRTAEQVGDMAEILGENLVQSYNHLPDLKHHKRDNLGDGQGEDILTEDNANAAPLPESGVFNKLLTLSRKPRPRRPIPF